jgi:hypothetical protein
MSHDGDDAELRCEPGRHPDVTAEPRRRQLAAAAARAWHSNHFGHRVEVTAAGRQLIEGAYVEFVLVGPDIVGAETFSDATGGYLLCGLPETRLISLFAMKNGYSRDDLWKSVDAGSDTTLDIELKR